MGTTYGATDGLGGPSMAAILGPGGPSTATYFAADGPGDLFWGDHLWHDRPKTSIATGAQTILNFLIIRTKR